MTTATKLAVTAVTASWMAFCLYLFWPAPARIPEWAPPADAGIEITTINALQNLYRFVDPQHGVVCYIHGARGIACLPLK